jgi:hypothetical protein
MNASVSTTALAQEAEWFASWFDSTHDQRLYAHRDRTGSGLRRRPSRTPFGTGVFDYVFNLFGDFADPADHLTVARNIVVTAPRARRATRPRARRGGPCAATDACGCG